MQIQELINKQGSIASNVCTPHSKTPSLKLVKHIFRFSFKGWVLFFYVVLLTPLSPCDFIDVQETAGLMLRGGMAEAKISLEKRNRSC